MMVRPAKVPTIDELDPKHRYLLDPPFGTFEGMYVLAPPEHGDPKYAIVAGSKPRTKTETEKFLNHVRMILQVDERDHRDAAAAEEFAVQLAFSMKDAWEAKLAEVFPGVEFNVTVESPKEHVDPVITFHAVRPKERRRWWR